MDTKTRLMTLTAAAMLAGSAAFAQVDPGPSAPSTFDFSFLSDLFGGAEQPSGDAIADALAGAGLTVERLRTRGDDLRIEATTVDGQRVRIRVEDGEIRYRIRPASDSSDSNGDTSDSNGDSSDSNGSSTGSSDANGNTSGGGNRGGGNGGGSKD